MTRVAIAVIMLFVLSLPLCSYALTPDEIDLLRRAGVSEDKINEMSGQSQEPKPEPAGGKTDTPVGSFSITDWNEDGVNDIIAGTNNGELNVYINKSTDTSPEFDGRDEFGEVDSGSVSVPCIVDWNNDGLKDVLMGNRNGTVYVFINKGSNAKPAFEKGYELMDGDVDAGSYSAPTVVDWNADGKKDLIVGDFNGHLNVYINIGTDEDPRFDEDPVEVRAEHFNFSTLNYTTPFAVINYNNGLFDILAGCGDGRVYRFVNTGRKGEPHFLTPQPILVNGSVFELKGNTNVIAVDWNKDGKEDLLVSNRMSKQTEGMSSSNAFAGPSGVKKLHNSKVYFLKNTGTSKQPRYDRAVEILSNYVDVNL
jgi:FG-GAP-like repeat